MTIQDAGLREEVACKICGSSRLRMFAHTATCLDCGVLLNWPYVPAREDRFLRGVERSAEELSDLRLQVLRWHIDSGARNHHNFTAMALFALSHDERWVEFKVLDFGGGGGQFALVLRSLFPRAQTYIVDLEDAKLLDEYRALNIQIPFASFESDQTKFDIIFVNDVFEHLTDPIGALRTLRAKLQPHGRIFIDTPRKFWLYEWLRPFLPGIQAKVLRGTVDHDHQQIWSRKAFDTATTRAGLKVRKIKVLSEYTQPATFYLDNMGIRNPLLRLMGRLAIAVAPWIARNKFQAVVSP